MTSYRAAYSEHQHAQQPPASVRARVYGSSGVPFPPTTSLRSSPGRHRMALTPRRVRSCICVVRLSPNRRRRRARFIVANASDERTAPAGEPGPTEAGQRPAKSERRRFGHVPGRRPAGGQGLPDNGRWECWEEEGPGSSTEVGRHIADVRRLMTFSAREGVGHSVSI